jgi:hypothetical protein
LWQINFPVLPSKLMIRLHFGHEGRPGFCLCILRGISAFHEIVTLNAAEGSTKACESTVGRSCRHLSCSNEGHCSSINPLNAEITLKRVNRHSVRIEGKITSISIEPEFWDALLETAKRKKTSARMLVEEIAAPEFVAEPVVSRPCFCSGSIHNEVFYRLRASGDRLKTWRVSRLEMERFRIC